jgi:hypothetical protein
MKVSTSYKSLMKPFKIMPHASAMLCAASFPLGSNIAWKRSSKDRLSPYLNPADVPYFLEALFEVLTKVLIGILYSINISMAAIAVTILVRLAISCANDGFILS